MVERFVNRLVGVLVLDVFADDADGHFMGRIADALQHAAPVADVQRLGLELQLLDDQFIQPIIDQAERHFVDAEFLVALLDDGPVFHVAEQGDLLGVVLGQLAFGPANEDVRLDTDLPQPLDAVLRRLGLRFAGRLQIGDQRQMDIQHIRLAHIEGELANGFQKRQALDVADRAADFGDDDIHVIGGQLADRRLDLVGHVRNDLHGAAQVFALAFLLDDRQINLARGEIAIAAQRGVGEAFVMAQVEVGFARRRRAHRLRRADTGSWCPDRR